MLIVAFKWVITASMEIRLESRFDFLVGDGKFHGSPERLLEEIAFSNQIPSSSLCWADDTSYLLLARNWSTTCKITSIGQIGGLMYLFTKVEEIFNFDNQTVVVSTASDDAQGHDIDWEFDPQPIILTKCIGSFSHRLAFKNRLTRDYRVKHHQCNAFHVLACIMQVHSFGSIGCSPSLLRLPFTEGRCRRVLSEI